MKIIDILRDDIASNRIVTDGKLPPMREVSSRYKCGTTTVKRAFDLLEQEGVIRVIRGQGTFVIGHEDAPQQKKSKLIGAILLNGALMCEISAMKDEYLKKGWLFSIYDASVDRQSPKKEKLFLTSAMKQNFSCFIIAASPLEPVNTELFMRLRAQGCKVIHTAPYKKDMSDECYFFIDYAHAAGLATWKIATAGYKNVVYLGRENTAPHVEYINEGVENTISDAGLNLVQSFTVHHKETEAIIECLKQLPPQTAIISFDTEIGEIVNHCAERLGKSAPRDFGLVSILNVFGINASHSSTHWDVRKIVSDLMEYATDETQTPFDRVQRMYRCKFCDKGTL